MSLLKRRSWTVFFLIRSVDNNNTDSLIIMLSGLMQIQFPDEVSMLLCINFNGNNLEAIRNLDTCLIDKRSPPRETTMFFKITTVDNGHRNTLEILAEKADFRIDREEDLSNFLTNRVLRYYEAKHYLLFTWDHGNGFEIFSGVGDEPKVNRDVAALTMDELARAIGWSLKDKKIHLAIMMNCYMQVFDTGYALRNHVKYLVAPQTFLGFLEYDYSSIFSYLAQKPNVSPRKLSAHVIRSFQAKSITTGTGLRVALSVCRLKHFDLMAMLLNQLATRLLQRLPQEFDSIRKAFETAHLVEGKELLDLYSLLAKISAISKGEEQLLINQLLSLKDRGVYRRYIGRRIFAPTGNAAEVYNGISILTPFELDLLLVENFEKFFMRSLFLRESEWGKLFRELQRLDPIVR